MLYYGNKIGEYYHENKRTGAVERYRDNVGTALTYGFESMLNWNISKTFFPESNIRLSAFLNSAFTGSRYLASDVPNIEGNEVEFVPLVNMKTGLEFGYKGLRFSTQLSYVSEQFAEATNQVSKENDNPRLCCLGCDLLLPLQQALVISNQPTKHHKQRLFYSACNGLPRTRYHTSSSNEFYHYAVYHLLRA
ncbi:MAG: hypothetical protein CR962_01775 [Gammaproteobacteria bacterium]|nr:MAG: hypothetical protein CR962_01775 [Gammaproteobacteria bacterium]